MPGVGAARRSRGLVVAAAAGGFAAVAEAKSLRSRLKVGRKFWELVTEALEAPSGPDALATLLCYLFRVGDPNPDQVKDFLIEQAGDKGEEAYVTAAERLTKDAAEKAAKKGRAEGRAAVVLKLLELRFSPLTAEAVEWIEQASAEQLDVWVERVLSAETLDDVFA